MTAISTRPPRLSKTSATMTSDRFDRRLTNAIGTTADPGLIKDLFNLND